MIKWNSGEGVTINYQVKNTLGNVFQPILTIFLFLIIADVILSMMGSIFPFQALNRLSISKFDLIISILLIIFLAINYFIVSTKKRKYNLRNVIVIILAIIPFEFIFLSIFGFEMGLYLSILLYVLIILHLIGLISTLRIFGSRFISFSRKNGLGYGIIAITTIFIIGTILFYIFEDPVNPSVLIFEDFI